MTNDQLTVLLAKGVMGWGIGTDRFMTGAHHWTPRWRFQPAERLDDAFRLLEAAHPQSYIISGDEKGDVRVCVHIAGSEGEAQGTSCALAITRAVACAIGIELEP